MSRSRWAEKSPLCLLHKDRSSTDTAGGVSPAPFLKLGRGIGKLSLGGGYELKLGGPPPSHF